jgi:hypothetical protein
VILRPRLDRRKQRRQGAPLIRQPISVPCNVRIAALQYPLLDEKLQPIGDD